MHIRVQNMITYNKQNITKQKHNDVMDGSMRKQTFKRTI